MRTYKLIIDELGGEILKATEGEKNLWIPLDPRNSHYAEYLRYTAWVEAGNKPEDFWTQQEDFEIAHDTLPSEEQTKIETDLGE